MMKEEISSRLIREIHAVVSPGSVYGSQTTPEKLELLRQINDKILDVLPRLSCDELIELSTRFSAAFKPLNMKPAWAVQTCRLIDRMVMSQYSMAYAMPLSDLPHTEFSPRGVPRAGATNVV